MDRSACAQCVKLVDASAVTRIVPVRGRPGRAAEAPTKVRRPRRDDAAATPLTEKPGPLAAEAPDAAPRRLDQVVRAAAHAVVLAAVVGFVLVYCVVLPIRSQVAGNVARATVLLVGNPLLDVRAPNIEGVGVFHAVRPLGHGELVLKGQLLGEIESPKLDDDVARAAVTLRALEEQQLRLDQRLSAAEPTPDESREARELAGRVAAAQQALAHLHEQRRGLRVVAPADGYIQQGLPARLTVGPHQPIALVYPECGDLLVEVSAPLDVLNDLLQRNTLEADVQTTAGAVRVSATPVPGSVRHFTKSVEGRRDETWATVQCIPDPLPLAARAPGLMGKIKS